MTYYYQPSEMGTPVDITENKIVVLDYATAGKINVNINSFGNLIAETISYFH